MANFVFPIAKGRWVEKYLLPIGSDNIVIALLQSTGLQSDATLQMFTTLGAILTTGTGSNTEATFTNYTRPVLASANITVSYNTPSAGTTTVSIPSQVWMAAGGATNNSLGALLTCYRPTSGSADSALVPLTKHDFVVSTTGGNLTATITSIGTAS